MDDLINQLQFCDINTKYSEIVRVDIESIKITYISMMKGHDFELTLEPNEQMIHCDTNNLKTFIKTNMQNIITQELVRNFGTVDSNLLNSIMDYYVDIVCYD